MSCKRDEDDGNSDIDDKDNCNDDGTGDNILITLEIIFGKNKEKDGVRANASSTNVS